VGVGFWGCAISHGLTYVNPMSYIGGSGAKKPEVQAVVVELPEKQPVPAARPAAAPVPAAKKTAVEEAQDKAAVEDVMERQEQDAREHAEALEDQQKEADKKKKDEEETEARKQKESNEAAAALKETEDAAEAEAKRKQDKATAEKKKEEEDAAAETARAAETEVKRQAAETEVEAKRKQDKATADASDAAGVAEGDNADVPYYNDAQIDAMKHQEVKALSGKLKLGFDGKEIVIKERVKRHYNPSGAPLGGAAALQSPVQTSPAADGHAAGAPVDNNAAAAAPLAEVETAPLVAAGGTPENTETNLDFLQLSDAELKEVCTQKGISVAGNVGASGKIKLLLENSDIKASEYIAQKYNVTETDHTKRIQQLLKLRYTIAAMTTWTTNSFNAFSEKYKLNLQKDSKTLPGVANVLKSKTPMERSMIMEDMLFNLGFTSKKGQKAQASKYSIDGVEENASKTLRQNLDTFLEVRIDKYSHLWD
jgi:hypothetical protein